MENRRKRKMMKEIGYFVAIFLILSIPLYYVVKIITTTIIEERQEDITIKGAGSGVGLPLYDDWFKRYGNEEGIYIVYNKLEWRQSLLNLFLLSKRSSFSGGEQTLKEEELRANGLQQIPIAGSSVALIYHFPPGQINSSYQLNLTIDLITQIYNGSIIYWNDPSVMALNPQLNNFHFDTRIVPIYFTEENGATLLFTSGLSRTSPWWALNIGSGLTVDWPIENGVVSSVTSSVEMLLSVNATNWSIGYVIYSDILNRDLIGYNLDLPSMANLCTISTTSKCLHNLTLTLPISLQSFEFNTLNTSNNEVVFPPVNFTLTPNLWPFSGYSYYIINTTYYFPSGCSTFLGNFQNFFNWLANSPIAQSQATLLGYYFNTTYFTELNYQPLECYYPLPSPTPYSVVAVLLLIALLMSLFGLRYLCVHRKKSSIERFEDFSIKLEVSPLLTKAKIDSADVTLLEQIGSGSFGEVYKGKWKGTDVAVKRILLKSQSDEDSILEEFFKEVHLMSTLRHPHIVKFLGASVLNPHLILISELAENGSLFSVLMNKAVELDFKKKINFCIDAAKGLNYLHSLTPPVIHRDLKTANLLVDKFWRVKVADFGLSRVVDTQDTMTHCGTLDFCAPEILIRARYTIKADIYSFAVCIWQIFTRRKPYPNVPLYQMAKDVVQSNVRPNLSYIKIASLRNLIERGWTVVPQDRPSMEEILHQLKAIKKDYSQKQKTRELGAQPPPNLSIN